MGCRGQSFKSVRGKAFCLALGSFFAIPFYSTCVQECSGKLARSNLFFLRLVRPFLCARWDAKPRDKLSRKAYWSGNTGSRGCVMTWCSSIDVIYMRPWVKERQLINWQQGFFGKTIRRLHHLHHCPYTSHPHTHSLTKHGRPAKVYTRKF